MKVFPAALLAVLLLVSPALALQSLSAPSPSKIELLGLETEGRTIVFVLQHSGAMLDTFDPVRTAINRAIRPMVATQSVSVIAVSEQTQSLCGGLDPATRSKKKAIASAMASLSAQGRLAGESAPWLDAFSKMSNIKPDAVFLITTGGMPQDVIDAIEKTMTGVKCPLFIVGIHMGEPCQNADAEKDRLRDIETLKKLVARTGGGFVTCSEEDLKAALLKPEPPEPADVSTSSDKRSASDGDLFPDIAPGTASKPKPKPAAVPVPPPAPVVKAPAPAPKPAPPVAAIPPTTQVAARTFTPSHRITLSNHRVVEGILTRDGSNVVIKMEMGTISVNEKQIEKIEELKN